MKAALFLGLLFFADNALAWGLQTHVFLAGEALAAAPAHPLLVYAGACLPDLSLAGAFLGTPAFRRAHLWSTLRRLAAAPRSDEERALAVGYATHLLADVVAHNAFVPEHEERIARIPHFTHALAEWAMDKWVSPRLHAQPTEVLRANEKTIVRFVARHFRCGDALAARAVGWIAAADGWLRASPVPRICLALLGARRFDGYLARAADNLGAMQAALDGRLVDWISSDPEGRRGEPAADRRAGKDVARVVQS